MMKVCATSERKIEVCLERVSVIVLYQENIQINAQVSKAVEGLRCKYKDIIWVCR